MNELVKIEKKRWREAKSRVIRRIGSVRALARKLGCHPNSIREAVSGRCPGVLRRIPWLTEDHE